MSAFSLWEWALILIIIILVFGVGRLTRIGKELGKAVSEFRKAFKGEQTAGQKTTGEEDHNKKK